jgi:hypothetical protein
MDRFLLVQSEEIIDVAGQKRAIVLHSALQYFGVGMADEIGITDC